MVKKNKRLLFIKSIEKTDECILWPWALDKHGYGQFSIENVKPHVRCGAHRYSCMIHNGNPPDESYFAIHSCGIRSCVNPKHLRWGTASDNMQDRFGHGTDPCGERNGRAKLTWCQVKEIRASSKMHKELASLYGVSAFVISAIKRNEIWKDNQ